MIEAIKLTHKIRKMKKTPALWNGKSQVYSLKGGKKRDA